MTIEVGQVLQGVGLPQNDVSLFATGCYKSVFGGVHETIYTFLVEVECLATVVKRVQVVHVYESI